MSGWAAVKAHLTAYLPTLDGLDSADAVSEGVSLSKGQRLTFATVGSTGDDDTIAGWYEVTDDEVTGLDAEQGDVIVRLTARSGDTDLTALSQTVEGWVTALRQHFKADRTLGGVLMQGSTVHVGRIDVSEAQTSNGAIVQNTVAVHYFTRL